MILTKNNKTNALERYGVYSTEKKALAEEIDKIETIMRNIERYDGTEAGQEDVPK